MDHKKIAKEAFEYLNKLRKDPKIAIPKLNQRVGMFKGKEFHAPGEITLLTNEGAAVVQETIQFLQKQKPLGELKWDESLEKACRDHVNDIGPKGICGHDGSDKSTMSDRIERYCDWDGKIGENISFGQKTGEDVILQLIVDDGVPSRGHRTNCFQEAFHYVGIVSGPHEKYKSCCVFDYAGGVGAKGSQKQKQQADMQQLQQQMQNMKMQQGKDDKMPAGCVGKSTQTSVSIKNGKKTTVTTTTYKFANGSTKTEVQEVTEG